VRFSLIPRNYRFYDLFEASAHNLVLASEVLSDLLEHFENVEMKIGRIRELEHDGDGVTHELYTQLYRTFVTPLDREDIAALAQRMDDVMDFMEGAATAIRIYGIREPTAAAKSLSDLVRLQCVQIQRAIGNLRHSSKLRKIQEQLVEIHRLENEADSLFLTASAELFEGEMTSVDIIKWRDIYDQLERATDSGESVAHVLEAIVLKHA
jgi:predicted phosphate transport protein (TIGR00153 family)